MLRRNQLRIAGLCALFTCTLGATVQRSSADDGAAIAKSKTANEQTLAERLNENSPVSFSDTSLTEVIEFLAQRHKVPIVIDGAALKEAEIDPSVKVNVTLEQVALKNLLSTVLESLKLDWTISNEVVLVTTANVAGSTRDVRIYPVGELVALGFGQKDENAGRIDLREAIYTVVEPRTWKEANGEGTISWYGSALVVRQTRDVHQQVDELLKDLERAFAGGEQRRATAAEQRIEMELQKETSLNFVDIKLREAIEFIAQQHHIPILFNTEVIEAAKVDLDSTLISGIYEKIKLESALNLILAPLKLGFVVQDQVLKITGQGAANSTMQTRVYVAADLVTDEFNTQRLANVIVDATGPENWAGGGPGIRGSLAALPGCVVVRQSHRLHREIETLLQKLRGPETRNKPTPPAPPPSARGKQ